MCRHGAVVCEHAIDGDARRGADDCEARKPSRVRDGERNGDEKGADGASDAEGATQEAEGCAVEGRWDVARDEGVAWHHVAVVDHGLVRHSTRGHGEGDDVCKRGDAASVGFSWCGGACVSFD